MKGVLDIHWCRSVVFESMRMSDTVVNPLTWCLREFHSDEHGRRDTAHEEPVPSALGIMSIAEALVGQGYDALDLILDPPSA